MPTVAIPANTPTSLGTITPQPGQMTTVTINRIVSPNAVSAPTLNGLSASVTVTLTILASTDGVNFFQKAQGTASGGVQTQTVGGVTSNITSCSLAVSMGPGEVQHQVQIVSSAACGLSATVATASAVNAS